MKRFAWILLALTFWLAGTAQAQSARSQAKQTVPKPKPLPVETQLEQMLAPTFVDFDCNKLPIDPALTEFFDKTHANINRADPHKSTGTITAHHKHDPWVVVVADIANQGKLDINNGQMYKFGPCTLSQHGPKDSPYPGPFVFARQTQSAVLPYTTSLRFEPQMANAYRVDGTLSLLAEPKVCVVAYFGLVGIDAAVDDRGRSMIPPNLRVLHPADDYRICKYPGDVRLGYSIGAVGPQPAGVRIIRGAVRLVFGVNPVSYDLADLLTGGTCSVKLINGMTAKLHGYQPDSHDNSFTVSLSIDHKGDIPLTPKNKMPTTYNLMQPMYFEMYDQQGHLWRQQNFDQDRNVDDLDYDLDFVCDTGYTGKPTHLSVTIPTATQERTIPFEFDNVPVVKRN